MLIPARTGTGAVARTDSPWAASISTVVPVLAAITVIGAIVRFATLTTQSYWIDEATTVHELHLSLGAMLHALRVGESTPPLYFVVAWLWAKLFGTGEAGLRSLSALAGTATIPVAYLCGRELVSRGAGIAAAALTAVSPFMIWYSQEARAYMLFGLACGLSLLFFARSERAPSRTNLTWWAVSSALAILTHFFAGFLVAPEAVWLLLKVRRRETVTAVAAVAAVQAALVPLLAGDASHPLAAWIKQFPLHVRIEQVPVDFGLGTLYQSSAVTHGLLAASVLAAIALVLVLAGWEREHRRGVALAAALAAAALLVPLLLAEFGRDYYVARNLMPAWIPLAVVLGAACAAPRTLPAGAALAAVLLGSFVYADFRIGGDSVYQRPNWRGVAGALGVPLGTRAVIADDGPAATVPLAVYLPRASSAGGARLPGAGKAPVRVVELDVIGNVWQATPRILPTGTRLLSARVVDGYAVDRFAVSPPLRLTPRALRDHASRLLVPAPPNPAILIQPVG